MLWFRASTSDDVTVHRSYLYKEQQRVTVGPGNAHVIIRQVSSDAAALHVRFAAAVAAAIGQFTD